MGCPRQFGREERENQNQNFIAQISTKGRYGRETYPGRAFEPSTRYILRTLKETGPGGKEWRGPNTKHENLNSLGRGI